MLLFPIQTTDYFYSLLYCPGYVYSYLLIEFWMHYALIRPCLTGDRAIEIGLETDENSRDEYNEYLVLDLGNGETATFCNSHVDMFRI